MGCLTLVRHGQSAWNLENRFTGWVDVDLSENGVKEALQAGQRLKNLDLHWSKAHTSRLLRAQRTLEIILKEMEQSPLVWKDSALNERHYGDLQGRNKDEARQEYGEEQVHIWRRSYNVPPPGGECLADTAKRCLPYFREYILDPVKQGDQILVVAHGNSLRAIIMSLKGMSEEEILQFEIETGVPYIFWIDSEGRLESEEILHSS